MNSKIAAVAEAVVNDPALGERLTAASSADERVTILTEAGLEVPSDDDLASVSDDMLAQLSAAGVGTEGGISVGWLATADSAAALAMTRG